MTTHPCIGRDAALSGLTIGIESYASSNNLTYDQVIEQINTVLTDKPSDNQQTELYATRVIHIAKKYQLDNHAVLAHLLDMHTSWKHTDIGVV